MRHKFEYRRDAIAWHATSPRFLAMLTSLVLLLGAVAAQSLVAYGEEDPDPADNGESVSSVDASADSTDSTTSTDATSTDTDTDTDTTSTDATSPDTTSPDTTSTDTSTTSTDATSTDTTGTDTTSTDSPPGAGNPTANPGEPTATTDPGTGERSSTPPAPPVNGAGDDSDSSSADSDSASSDADSITIFAVAGGTVDLGTADAFGVLAGTTVTNTGPTVVCGNVGVSPGTAVVGFPPGTVICGVIHAADAVAAQAQSDLTIAYDDAAGRACDVELTGSDLGGLTLVSGVYCFDTSAFLTGTVTLDAQGDPNAVFIFQIGSTLITASGSTVDLINGAQACNVFWQVGSSATLGTDTTFVGNILALTSITAQTGTTVDGRLLARNGAVTLDDNVIVRAECAIPDDEGGGGGDTGGGGGTGGDTGGGGGGTGGDTGGGGGSGGGGGTGGGGGSGGGTGDGSGKTGSGTGTDDSLIGTGTGTGNGSAGAVSGAAVDSKSGGGQGNLPFTGLNVLPLALAGMLALLLGVLLRRHTRQVRISSAAPAGSSAEWQPRGASIRQRPPQ